MITPAGSADHEFLGVGLYTPPQAARLARIRPQTLRRWLFGTAQGEAALRRQHDGPEEIVTFVDMIQLLAVRAMRTESAGKVSLQRIRRAVQIAEEEYDLSFPFARKHTTYLFDDDVVIRIDDRLVQITGQYKHNDLLKPVVELYLEDLSFDDADGLAVRYTPVREVGREVRIEPSLRFGQPVIWPCQSTVDGLVAATSSEGSIENAAAAHGVARQDVLLALRYDDILRGVAA